MAYYLGKDVGLVVSTEDPSYGVTVTAANALSSASPGATIGPRALAGYSTPNFNESIGVISNLTGVDLGIGSTDEDVSFMGANTPLKAEVHKETTLTITKKKNSTAFDVIFSGDTDGTIGRWGVSGAAVRDGLTEPSDGGFGYRLYLQLKAGTEIFCIRNAQMTSHTVSLNANGTQEETVEFTSQVNPQIFAASGSVGLAVGTPGSEL